MEFTKKIYETKRNFTVDETKRSETKFRCFWFRETSEISRNKFYVSLCFVFRETKKKDAKWKPVVALFSHKPWLWLWLLSREY
jgi:hypothetical protein